MGERIEIIELTETYGARNYLPLPVVIARAEGVWAWDEDGRRYLDCLSAYSALNQGHRHPRIIQALTEQAGRVTITSRAFHNDRLGRFLGKLCGVTGMDMALPMNTGAEAVETAIKAARKWGYDKKGIEPGGAEIIVCEGNFHGRTITTVSASSQESYKRGFEPLTPGFKRVPYGDAAALQAAITRNTTAFLAEPIQGEGGIIMPPDGYLAEAGRLCRENNVLFMLDEIQTGLGRTGRMFCHEHDGEAARPDVLVLGKALGGGVIPVSAVAASREVMEVFSPGTHGSTFGGSPLASAVGEASLDVIVEEDLARRAAQQGEHLLQRLRELDGAIIADVRGRGLLIGIEVNESAGPARAYCEALLKRGMLCNDTHKQVIRLAPPLIIETEQIDWMVAQLQAVLGGAAGAVAAR